MALNFKNVSIAGEPTSGKTQLCEAIAFKSGISTRLNLVEKGQSIYDSQKDEKERQLSIDLAVGFFEKDGTKVNFIDTPGYADFIGEVITGIWASDFVLIVVDASRPLSAYSKRAYKIAGKYKKPVAFFINQMGRDNADFPARFAEIKDKITINVAPFFIAGRDGDKDILNDESEAEYREKLLETIASSDDALLEKYLSNGILSKDEIREPLAAGISSGKIVPILSGDALSGAGVENLMDFIVNFAPPPPKSEGNIGKTQIFKISAQSQVGEVFYAKVLSGTIHQGDSIYNINKKTSFRITQINKIQGAEKIQVSEAAAGDIVGFVKLKDVVTGDTLSLVKNEKAADFVEFPQPIYSVSVRSKTPGGEEKVATSLASIRRENSIVSFGYNPETKQMLISGMGNVQLDVLAKRIIENFGVEIELSPPRVPYKETITVLSDAEGKHKKQSGGHGQFGRVVIKFEPLEKGSGFEFVNKIVGGAIPGNYIPAIEKGLVAALEKGIIAGYPMVDLRATLYDGSFHEVDSSNLSFEIAASLSLKNAIAKARPIVLEPIMTLEISFPDEFTGSISGDITSRRGRITSFDKDGDTQIIKAEVPQSEIMDYVNNLRSMTKGQGEFTTRFSHYEPAPPQVMNSLVDAYNQQKAEGR